MSISTYNQIQELDLSTPKAITNYLRSQNPDLDTAWDACDRQPDSVVALILGRLRRKSDSPVWQSILENLKSKVQSMQTEDARNLHSVIDFLSRLTLRQ